MRWCGRQFEYRFRYLPTHAEGAHQPVKAVKLCSGQAVEVLIHTTRSHSRMNSTRLGVRMASG